jgi:hypothetical protein
MEYFIKYLVVTGGVSAGLQVTRGLVRASGRLLHGQPRAALGEALGGLAAPALRVYTEAVRLGGDVWDAAWGLTMDGNEEQAVPTGPCCPGRPPAGACAPGGVPN